MESVPLIWSVPSAEKRSCHTRTTITASRAGEQWCIGTRTAMRKGEEEEVEGNSCKKIAIVPIAGNPASWKKDLQSGFWDGYRKKGFTEVKDLKDLDLVGPKVYLSPDKVYGFFGAARSKSAYCVLCELCVGANMRGYTLQLAVINKKDGAATGSDGTEKIAIVPIAMSPGAYDWELYFGFADYDHKGYTEVHGAGDFEPAGPKVYLYPESVPKSKGIRGKSAYQVLCELCREAVERGCLLKLAFVGG